jgi:hypothetical protein
VISSGYMVSERLRQEGFDAVFVPKGYDEQLLTDQGRERDIELALSAVPTAWPTAAARRCWTSWGRSRTWW